MLYPKISIVTPSFNQGLYIEQTIKSVLDQGYPNLEYIIIDGGSSDNSAEIIKKYENQLHYWISEPDNGQTHAITKGLMKATGLLFNWINSDDLLEEKSLFKIAKVYNEFPNVEVIIGNYKEFSEKHVVNIQYKSVRNSFYETVKFPVIKQPCTFYKLDVVRSRVKLNPELHYAMDYDLWIRYLCLSGISKVVEIPDYLAMFRIHEESKTSKLSENFKMEIENIYADYLVLKKTLEYKERVRLNISISLYYLNVLSTSFLSKQYLTARSYIPKINILFLDYRDTVVYFLMVVRIMLKRY